MATLMNSVASPLGARRPRHRLAVLTSHPIQYQAPLFRKLADHPRIDLMVYFCSDRGLRPTKDAGFGVTFAWDVPLTRGYRHRLLRNLSPAASSHGFWQAVNPGIVGELRRGAYDGLLIHGYAQCTNWLALWAARRAGTPVLLHGETFPGKARGSIKSWAKDRALGAFFRRVDAFLPIGSKSREFYQGYGIPSERMFLTPYAVDNDFFFEQAGRCRPQRDQIKADLGLPPGLPVVLYLSKLIPRKRPLDLLQAFEPLQDRAALVFVGDGESRGGLESWARERGLRHVRFTGFRNQTELPRYYAAADIFVLPSAYETWGLVLNEAMCFELPVIATDRAAASHDLIEEGSNGYVCPVGDIDTLRHRLTGLVRDKGLRERLGRRSAELVAGWSHDDGAEGIVQALESLSGASREAAEAGPWRGKMRRAA